MESSSKQRYVVTAIDRAGRRIWYVSDTKTTRSHDLAKRFTRLEFAEAKTLYMPGVPSLVQVVSDVEGLWTVWSFTESGGWIRRSNGSVRKSVAEFQAGLLMYMWARKALGFIHHGSLEEVHKHHREAVRHVLELKQPLPAGLKEFPTALRVIHSAPGKRIHFEK